MTEAEWLACDEPFRLAEFVRGRVSDRKLRLFCCACCSRYTRMFNDSSTEASASLLERYADGWVEESDRIHPNTFLHHNLVNEMWCPDPYLAALRAADGIAGDVGHRFNYGHQRDRAVQSEFAAQAVLFREIAGNPFSIAIFDPSWRTEAVVGLARGMYESRDFGPMPVLADAIEDAGCADPDVLAHCRGGGPHVRGCWVVDLVLGKE